ncbi:hypothetical protein CHLRE_16g681238v5 [Chlamydomonas reinhardtii]|uniref:TrmE-type G domain-containing protein n=1 Tax=Chlamydomonas reinhardtii TaxID=3055 RepID=A0A2K3CVZ3_CHLRE|nr:uncharacterized protein CHLRE_16g681238v5 [Chlamydomonas reinhardtii]PNW72451.1 hypothetical protein CHLRE_16g681238v5 [Chlamydomonas reinhardtii]
MASRAATGVLSPGGCGTLPPHAPPLAPAVASSRAPAPASSSRAIGAVYSAFLIGPVAPSLTSQPCAVPSYPSSHQQRRPCAPAAASHAPGPCSSSCSTSTPGGGAPSGKPRIWTAGRRRNLTTAAAASSSFSAPGRPGGAANSDDEDSPNWGPGGSGSGSGSGSDGEGGRLDGSSSSPVVLTTQDEDTISSIITGLSAGSVSIIRLSGTEAVPIALKAFRPGGRFRIGWSPASHRVYYGTAVDGDENVLDEVLLLVMLSPRSYTAEDVVEFHCHGGGVCAARVQRALIEAGARPAKPGEFTLRAFLNGRLDLAQAESVSELVGARTAAAADSALAGLRGGVGSAVSDMRRQCLDLLAELEARLDFDEDLPPIDVPALKSQIEAIQAGIEKALRTARAGSLLRRGLQVAIVGRPNVGKSSLLNAWTNSDRAIVTEIAGTTRDVLEAQLSVGGVPVTLLDTAGIRDSTDVVERIGVERSQAAAAAADVVIMVVDSAEGWTDADTEIYRSLWGDGPGSSGCRVRGPALLVANKDDLRAAGPASGGATASTDEHAPLPLPVLARETFSATVRTSASQRKGLESLDAALLDLAGAPQLAASGGVSWAVNERQAEALVRSHEALMRLSESVAADLPLDFWTIDLRSALLALGEVSGDEVAEEVLDNVFSRFCIGK